MKNDLKEFMEQREAQEEYVHITAPYCEFMETLEEKKKQEIAKITKFYDEQIAFQAKQMRVWCGGKPYCSHDLVLTANVLSGDYFDKLRKMSYCLCCKQLCNVENSIELQGTLNEEEFAESIKVTEQTLERIYMDNPNISIEEVKESLKLELKNQAR